jgi:hypothetical protein
VSGGKQFGGVYGPGTPILDPKLPDQSLEFAITMRDPFGSGILGIDIDTDPDGAFGDLVKILTAWRAKPVEIWDPTIHTARTSEDEVLLWKILTAFSPDFDRKSPEVLKTPDKNGALMPAFEGRLFVHGLFCAHDPESVLGTLPRNAYDAQIEPLPKDLKKFFKDAQRWRRP